MHKGHVLVENIYPKGRGSVTVKDFNEIFIDYKAMQPTII